MKLHTIRRPMFLGLLMATALGCGTADGPAAGDGGTATPAELSAAEREGLLFTREEEKLARDVYARLASHDPSFTNIGRSEQTHMDAMATLLTRYGLPDPAAGKAAGEFTNPTLQSLYDALVQRGTPSLTSALEVGVEIEELDIHDIETARQAVTHADILASYDLLTKGSRNHLRAFHGKLVAAGGTYTPKHLSASVFQAILDSPMERGQ